MLTTTWEHEVVLLAPDDQSGDSEDCETSYSFILVVEDDTPTMRLERVILEEEGFSVQVASSGEEALDIIATKSPSLVLLDIGLPGIDGLATCERIREISRVPVIMVTGRDCLDDKVNGMGAGADDYVTKPFLTNELAARIKVLLRRSTPDLTVLSYYGEVGQPARPTPTASPQDPKLDPNEDLYPHQEPIEEREEHPAASTAGPDDEITSSQELPNAPGERPSKLTAESPQEPFAQEEPAESSSEAEPESSLNQLPDDVYEGTIRLTVSTGGPVYNLINFVSELRQNPQFRLLRLVANQHKEGMDIWLGLREPVPLVSMLQGMQGVEEASGTPEMPSENDEHILNVVLS